MRYYFYALNPLSISNITDNELDISVENSFSGEIIVKFGESAIKLLPKDGAEYISTLDNLYLFEIVTPNDLSILRYLYVKYRLLFYDDEYVSIVNFLKKSNEPEIYDNTLREYVVDCMLHYGIVKDIKEINYDIMGDERVNFFNLYYVHMGMHIKLKRMRRELLFTKIKMCYKGIVEKIKNIIRN